MIRTVDRYGPRYNLKNAVIQNDIAPDNLKDAVIQNDMYCSGRVLEYSLIGKLEKAWKDIFQPIPAFQDS